MHFQEAKQAQPTRRPDSVRRVAQAVFVDHRPQAVAHRELKVLMERSPAAVQLKAQQALMNHHPPVAQRRGAGLPAQLQAGVESLSGMSMEHVRVHLGSDKPARLNAHAYTQGSEIFLAPGQERHLPHEAWHVVQQQQGRVKATVQLQGVGVNTDSALEHEADVMGARAAQAGAAAPQAEPGRQTSGAPPVQRRAANGVVQLAPEAVPANESRAYSANADGSSNIVEAQVKAILNGGAPSCVPTGWSDVLAKAAKVKGSWVRFHLLNQYLGGSGARKDNLVPTTVGTNHNATWRAMEQEAQTQATAGQWVWWRTQVTYHAANALSGYGAGFPSNINVQSKKWNGAAWVNLTAGGGNYDLAVSAPNFAGGQVKRYFHEITTSQWNNVVGVTNQSLIGALVRHSAEIKTVDDLSTKVFYAEQYNFEGLEEQIEKIDDAVQGNNPQLHILLEE